MSEQSNGPAGPPPGPAAPMPQWQPTPPHPAPPHPAGASRSFGERTTRLWVALVLTVAGLVVGLVLGLIVGLVVGRVSADDDRDRGPGMMRDFRDFRDFRDYPGPRDRGPGQRRQPSAAPSAGSGSAG